MEIGKHIHWYITERCNLDCTYCFRPRSQHEPDNRRNETTANALVESGVEKVTLTGGEPTLANDLVGILRILRAGSIYTSLHTNGILLHASRIKELDGLVDDIALPIDSTDRATQRKLKGERFLPTFDRLAQTASKILEQGMGLGYHTVFTAINCHDIPGIYDFISQRDFDYWRIYEFNEDLALFPLLADSKAYEKAGLAERIRNIQYLAGEGTTQKGYTDCLYADFLRAEEMMDKYGDRRIQFVGRSDVSTPYAFLDSKGDVSFYFWLSGRERRVIGNILEDGFHRIQEILQEVHEKDWEFDDKAEEDFWWATVGDVPLWARLWDGSYSPGELDEIRPEFLDEVVLLSERHQRRLRRRLHS